MPNRPLKIALSLLLIHNWEFYLMHELNPLLYTIAWIAPLEIEAIAALHMLDNKHYGRFPLARGDDYVFQAGDMCGHNIVIATLPAGQEYGTGSAAALASQVKKFFPNLWFGLLVGVAAGLPTSSGQKLRDIRLGDVLVAMPDGNSAGLLAYDLGKETNDNGFQPLHLGYILAHTETVVRSAIGSIKLSAPNDAIQFLKYYTNMKDNEHCGGTFRDPGQEKDQLYEIGENGVEHLVERLPRPDTNRTRVWYGPIGSGDKLVKNVVKRNELRDKYNLIGLEMEAAGTINRIPVGVFRGVCDYGDQYKSKEWQPYAAAMAAAYGKAVLAQIGPKEYEGKVELEEQNVLCSPRVNSHAVQDCLKSLEFTEMDWRSNAIETSTPGTCNWLLLHRTYRAWISCDQGLLWIKGKPGSGKSTLLRYVLDCTMRTPEVVIGSFFFHGRGSELQTSLQGLFRSLLHQMLSQAHGALRSLVANFLARKDTGSRPAESWQWHQNELRNLFRLFVSRVLEDRPVWLFVDALDESGEDNAIWLIKELKFIMEGLTPGLKLHICFTSRHYPILNRGCKFEICLEHENGDDISTYIQAQFAECPQVLASVIPAIITSRANGVFLWARLIVCRAVDLDNKGVGLAEIESMVNIIPPELDKIYEELLENMDDKPTTLKLFQWIYLAKRPLSLHELRWALFLDSDRSYLSLEQCKKEKEFIDNDGSMDRRLKALSCGLAEYVAYERHEALSAPLSDTGADRGSDFDDMVDFRPCSDAKPEPVTSLSSGEVQFIHQSVKDFLLAKGFATLSLVSEEIGLSTLSNQLGAAHLRIVRCCVSFLAMKEIAELLGPSAFVDSWNNLSNVLCVERWASTLPLLHYATTSWVYHTTESQLMGVAQDDILDYFAWPSETLLQLWARIYNITCTASFKRPDVIRGGTSMLHIAARFRLTDLLCLILQRAGSFGIDIDAEDGDDRTPLNWAVKMGHASIIEMLVDTGEVNTVEPLCVAASEGNVSIVQYFIDTVKLDVNSKGLGSLTPLQSAALHGSTAVVKLLLDTGQADIATKDSRGRSPLLCAAMNGSENVVKLLLNTGKVDINSTDSRGQSPLLWAAGKGYKAVVELLLDTRQIDINCEDSEGQSPLLWAVKNEYEAVVKLLLDTGKVDVATKDSRGRSPLLYAAMNGSENVVKLLLNTGKVDINSKDSWGQSPLWWAAYNGHETIVKLLLDTGRTELNSKDQDGRTSLWWAARRGYAGVVRLLLDTGRSNVDSKDKKGHKAIWWASIRGHKDVVRLLYQHRKSYY